MAVRYAKKRRITKVKKKPKKQIIPEAEFSLQMKYDYDESVLLTFLIKYLMPHLEHIPPSQGIYYWKPVAIFPYAWFKENNPWWKFTKFKKCLKKLKRKNVLDFKIVGTIIEIDFSSYPRFLKEFDNV